MRESEEGEGEGEGEGGKGGELKVIGTEGKQRKTKRMYCRAGTYQ